MKEFFSALYTPDPGVVDGVLALAVIYALAVGPGRRYLAPQESFDRRRAACFAAAVLVLLLAVATPIDHIGETYLFSVHMVQHILLTYILAPLVVISIPPWLADFLFRTEGLGKVLRFFVHPVVSCATFSGVLIFWHFPAFYELALRDSLVHLLEHITFIWASILMYWPLLGAESTVRPMHNGLKLLYILAVSIGQLPLFGVLTFSSSVLYPTYAAAPRYYPELSPLGDQILGGIIMKLVAAVYMFGGLVVYFYRWYSSEQTRHRR